MEGGPRVKRSFVPILIVAVLTSWALCRDAFASERVLPVNRSVAVSSVYTPASGLK